MVVAHGDNFTTLGLDEEIGRFEGYSRNPSRPRFVAAWAKVMDLDRFD